MSKLDLGSKRIDPETGRKFYDLNKDPVVSPYTGKSYPRSFFESLGSKSTDREVMDEENILPIDDAVLISLVDTEDRDVGDVHLPDLDDDSVFLEEEKEEDDDVSDIIKVEEEDDL